MSGETLQPNLVGGLFKLKGTQNYLDWKFQMQNYLDNKGLWSAASPKIKADGSFEAVNSDRDRQSRSLLCMSIEPVCYPKVRAAKTAQKVWTMLN